MIDTGPMAKSIAARIREQRLQRGWTQEQVAATADVPFSTYRLFEATGAISLRHLIAVLDALGLVDRLRELIPAAPQTTALSTEARPARQRAWHARRVVIERNNPPRTAAVSSPASPPKPSHSAPPSPATTSPRNPRPVAPGIAPSAAPIAPAFSPATPPTAPLFRPYSPPGPPATPPPDYDTLAAMPPNDRMHFDVILRDVVQSKLTNQQAKIDTIREIRTYISPRNQPTFARLLDAELRRISPADLDYYHIYPPFFETWRQSWRPDLGIGWGQ